jgi:glycosyltransferase involved in cell wall biosynthesis
VADPLVSVVIPTRNRPARLERLLASLRAQTLSRAQFEVIVVDDGSGVETGGVIAAEAVRGELRLSAVRHPVALGPAAARNSGWRASEAPLVAFTDDDCVASPDWLREVVGVHAKAPGSIIQGPTRPDPGELDQAGPFSRTLHVEQLGPQYETCNIVYPRMLLDALGGFDETFGPGPTAEDTDLAWRAIETGGRTVFASEAVVFHAVERLGAVGMLRVATRWTAAVGVLARYPAVRSSLYRGRFWNVWHYLLWRSVLVLAAPAWLRRLVLTRHLLALNERAAVLGGSPATVPFLVVHDAVECWAIARGALRYRTLVL